MKKTLKSVCMAGFAFLLLACSKSDKSSGGHVTGKVTDTQGKPIAGAEIVIDNTVLYNANQLGTTNGDGTYKIKLAGSFTWMAHAKFKKNYNGKNYTFKLHPDNSEGFTSAGAVRNFSWKLKGEDPQGTNLYYGAMIQLQNQIGEYTPAEEVEFTLTPDGPLADGSTGQTIKMKGGDWGSPAYYKLVDIPLGRYKMTARFNNSTVRLKNYITNQTAAELTLNFEPSINVTGTVCDNCAIIEFMPEN